jgi:hypothetical protein
VKKKFPWKTVTAVVGGAAALAGLDLALRPLFLKWGATDKETGKTWPGDELSPDPASTATRAVTIHAPADKVWPWLVQIGQDRGGFYSYTWLENLVGAKIRNADRILPGIRPREVGDTVWMAPPERYGGRGCSRVAQVEPGRALVLVSPEDYDEVLRSGSAANGTWAFLLAPIDERTTRLIVRSRSGRKAGPGRILFFDPIHFVMERKMMLGIKARAEAHGAERMRSSVSRLSRLVAEFKEITPGGKRGEPAG